MIQKEIKETIPYTITTNNITYLEVTLIKQVKDLYDKNFSLQKSIYKFNEVSIKITTQFLQTLKEQFLTSYGKITKKDS